MDGRAPTERELLDRFAAGDEEAFHALFERHARALQRFAASRLPDALRRRVSVADVVQEAHIVAHARAAAFELRDEQGFRNWLLRIVEMKVKEAVRRNVAIHKRSLRHEVGPARRPGTADFAGRGPSPSQVAIGGELAERVAAAMAALPPDYRRVLALVRDERLSLGEAGERLGRSREAAKKLYARALSRFTAELRARGGLAHGA